MGARVRATHLGLWAYQGCACVDVLTACGYTQTAGIGEKRLNNSGALLGDELHHAGKGRDVVTDSPREELGEYGLSVAN